MKKNTLKKKLFFSILIFSCSMFSVNCFAENTIIEYSKDPGEIILSFTETHGIMSGEDAKTTMKIYGDGAVEVYVPVFMKRAGNYQMKLNKAQLDLLLQDILANNITEFDAVKTQSDKNNESLAKQATSGQVIFYEVHDASVTTIDLNFDRYLKLSDSNSINGKVFDSSNEILNMRKNISWKGIRADSKKFPDIEAIQQLAATQQSILGLINNSELVKK